MLSTASIAYSGMQTSMLRLSTSANNIANARTTGYHRQLVVAQEQNGGGVTASVTQSEQANTDGVSPIDDLVQQLSATTAYQANFHSFQAAGKMAGLLLDVLA